MEGNTVFALLFALILVGYAVLYVGGRYYLREGFQKGAGADSPAAGQLYPAPPPVFPRVEDPVEEGECKREKVVMEYRNNPPYAVDAVRSLDEYEMSQVYENESDRELSQELRNKLMSQRPMDWAGLPPSSSKFQAGLRESFENATPTVPENAKPYKDVIGDTTNPPDTESLEMEERKILQTYKPKPAGYVEKYDVDNVEKMIREIYDKKGLIPTVAHKENSNVYEITGVRKKSDSGIVYEDEVAPAVMGPSQKLGEAKIIVPPAAYDYRAAKDPYYDTSAGTGGSRVGKWNYEAWTPGLERMFAPSNETQNWY
jgi:hypothetical protein